MEPEDREVKSLIFEQFPFFVGVNEKTQNVDEAQNWKVHCVKHLIFLEFLKNMILALLNYK